ncbi:MAG: aldehyde dehydrogenase family protein, partial [Noviherbaspirillum sp.]
MNIADIKRAISPSAAQFLERRSHPMLIDGRWTGAQHEHKIEVINPATEEVIAQVPAGDAGDIDLAVQAARRAFDSGPWSRMRPSERQRLLLKLADLIEQNAQAIAEIESIDNGKSVQMALAVDVALTIDFFRYMAGWATKIEGSTVDVSVPYAMQSEFVAYTRREPVGVVAAIVPWNFPLLLTAWKVAPALACGNT